jgi:hypothetical protein
MICVFTGMFCGHVFAAVLAAIHVPMLARVAHLHHGHWVLRICGRSGRLNGGSGSGGQQNQHDQFS